MDDRGDNVQGASDDDSPARRAPRAPRTTVVALIPAYAAGALAILYIIGAISRASQLRGAGLSVPEFLPLVPLQDLLTQGIATVMEGGFAVLIVLLVAVALLFLVMGAGYGASRTGRDVKRIGKKVDSIFDSRWYVVLLFFYSVYTIVAVDLLIGITSLSLPIFVLALGLRTWTRTELKYLLVIFLGFQASMTVVYTYERPRPLSSLTLRTNDGQTIRGALVVRRDGSWYVLERRRSTVRVVPDQQVRFALVRSQERSDPRSGYSYLEEAYRRTRDWLP